MSNKLINITEYIDSSAGRYPDKTVYADGRSALTFSELRDAARRGASGLLRDGCYKSPVAIYMDKSPWAIAACFAAVYSGNYYVVIDKEAPAERIRSIFETLRPRAVIHDGKGDTSAAVEAIKFKCVVYNYEDILGTKGGTETDETALLNVKDKAIDTDPVYVVFTSGSTGNPKGVTACHRSVIDYIENLTDILGIDENSVLGNQAPLYVDACLKEVYTAVKSGATAYLIPRETFMFPTKLIEYLNEYKINTICWVSSALSMVAGLAAFKQHKPEYLHTVAFGSELFPVKNLEIWREALPDARFFNLYGPTEATGMSCYYKIEPEQRFSEDEKIPIGKPFPNTEVILLDENNSRVTEPGKQGEICIRGTCLSLGYYGNPEKPLTVQNPLVTAYPDSIYRTGDIGSYNQNGDLVYHCRKDYQIKHMGYRIELPEIESAATRNKGVFLACCVYDSVKSKIILYYTGESEPKELSAALKKTLPRYMLPNKTVRLEEMPLTANGKTDRKLMQKV